jgi:hypothetical protein
MRRFFVIVLILYACISCSKNNSELPPGVIPSEINGVITEIDVTPINITTPDKGTFLISMNNTIYKVVFNAVVQAQSNAVISFATDTILNNESKEFANLGKDAIAYNPVKENEVVINFNDGRKVSGQFTLYTSFGGIFGEQLISQWRDSIDHTKPNQKAKDDIRNFIKRYGDIDGPGPDNTPVYLSAQVSKS